VDDDVVNLQVLGAVFEADHDVRLLESGTTALAQALEDPPDLILMDILMPDMDGLEACARLKQSASTQEIPVIFITGQGSPLEETAALATGAVDFITKPINPDVVRARVRTHLKLKAQSDALKAMAYLDGLTGVANLRRLEDYLQTEWRRCRRHGAPMSLLMADIDHFKHYNDTLGHPAGDDCLRQLAGALEGILKRPQDLLARYGGEEFTLVLPETDEKGAARVAREALKAVRALAIPHPGSTHGIVTLSLGASTRIPNEDQTVEELVAHADAGLNAAKAAGRNRCVAHGGPDDADPGSPRT